MNIAAMTEENAKAVSSWKYGGIYSFYDHSEENINVYTDGTHFACTDKKGELIGYYRFGEGARVPTIEEDAYDDGFLDIGLRLRPDLCGKSHGLAFLIDGLDYAQKTYCTRHFRLSVAVFNERAIKVYRKAGFYIEREVTNSYHRNRFYIMKYVR